MLSILPIFAACIYCIAAAEQLSPAQRACNNIKNALNSSVVLFPRAGTGRTAYDAIVANAYNLQNALSRPTCLVLPTETQHVQVAMRAIYAFKSRYAVRAGGHSAMHGWNIVQDGVLISFANMRNVVYDPIGDTVTVQPGIRWGEAITALESFGVAPVTGRLRDVGTGLLLGGGLGFLSPGNGFASDMYRELDVILPNGDLVTANATNKFSDLFWALKGCTNRCGIVTRYKLAVVHTGINSDKNYFGGSILYNSTAWDSLVTATAHYVQNTNDPNAVLFVTFFNSTTKGTTLALGQAMMFYKGAQFPAGVFDEILAIPALQTSLGAISYSDMTNLIQDPDETGNIQLFGGSAITGDENLFQSTLTQWNTFNQVAAAQYKISSLSITPIPKSQVQVSRQNGGNPMNPPLKNYATIAVAQELPDGVQTLGSAFQSARQNLIQGLPASQGFPLYINECDAAQNVFATYNNLARLKSVYKKYDPTRFIMEHSDGPMGL